MGLAATKSRQRLGLDPRNTTWSNDTSRFGHQHLEKLGWKPGEGLGMVSHATSTHIKVSIKDDMLGLGAKLKKKDKEDEFDSGECAGLDVFQRILGRLNGKETAISNELEKQRKEKIINGKWGIHFVKGEVLASTWDIEKMTLKSYSNETRGMTDKHVGNNQSMGESMEAKKKEKKEKKEKKVKKDKKEKKIDSNRYNDDMEEKRKKKKKKKKADSNVKKAKRDKKRKKDDNDSDSFLETSKKPKASNAGSDSSSSNTLEPSPITDLPAAVSMRLSVRSRWIKQKRAAVMDPQALKEIFMVTNQ